MCTVLFLIAVATAICALPLGQNAGVESIRALDGQFPGIERRDPIVVPQPDDAPPWKRGCSGDAPQWKRDGSIIVGGGPICPDDAPPWRRANS
ncbi:hypothetical protein C8R43DRAFT_1121214 [Mycena crocata]|nr:hypothetical protein C8R43DRAFT_1121214 [Mycena crocata]